MIADIFLNNVTPPNFITFSLQPINLDEFVKSLFCSFVVIPAKAGIQ